MSQLVDTRATPATRVRNPFNIGDIATASVLAILSGGGGVGQPIKSQKRGLWKHSQVQLFIRNHRYFLVHFLPSFEKAPSEGAINAYLKKYIEPVQFSGLFVEWTKEVAQSAQSIKSCDEEAVKKGLSQKLKRPIISVIYEWKEQNLLIEEAVDEVFGSVGKSKALNDLAKLPKQTLINNRLNQLKGGSTNMTEHEIEMRLSGTREDLSEWLKLLYQLQTTKGISIKILAKSSIQAHRDSQRCQMYLKVGFDK